MYQEIKYSIFNLFLYNFPSVMQPFISPFTLLLQCKQPKKGILLTQVDDAPYEVQLGVLYN
jgi:hypothetical protein